MSTRVGLFVIALLAVGAGPPGPPDPGTIPGPEGDGQGQTGNPGPGGAGNLGWPKGWGLTPDAASATGTAVGPPPNGMPAGAEEFHHCQAWPEVWGFIGARGFYEGMRTAPNGLSFGPLFLLDSDFNLSILPHKKLYLFIDSGFWAQRATDGVTNPHQGSFDFSKREFDISGGVAWNYWGPMELRVFGFAYNNLNRGIDPNLPYGYNDGVGVENRFYLYRPGVDIYDVGRLSFLSVGYLPSKSIVGLDGQVFKPGLLLHAYLTYDLPAIRSYLYGDGQYIGEAGIQPRLLLFEGGLAVRPFTGLQNLEFRVGGTDTYDVQVKHNQALGYLGLRIQF